MAPKRKRSAAVPEEAPVSKRQLRSGGQLPAAPTPSPTKRAVASRRVASPQKRATGSKKLSVIVPEELIEGSDDESNIESDGRDQARLPASPLETRYLSDETNTIRISSSAITKDEDVEQMEMDTPKRKPGRPRTKARHGQLKVRSGGFSTNHLTVVEEPFAPSDETNTIRVISSAVSNNVEQVDVVKRRGRPSKAKANAGQSIFVTLGGSSTNCLPVALSPVTQNTCIDQDATPQKPNKRILKTPALGSRKSTRGTPVVEILVCTPHRTKLPTIPARTKAIKIPQPIVPYGSSSSDDDDEPLAQSTSIEMTDARLAANQGAGPSTPRRTTQRHPEKAADPEEEESNSSEEEVSELAVVSPKKQISRADLNPSANLPGSLPDHLLPCFNAYRRAILKSLQCPSLALPAAAEDSINGIAVKQLVELIDGTVLRAEGNSCLLLGPRGSGKSQVLFQFTQHPELKAYMQ